MKRLLIILLLLPAVTCAQSKKDYEHVMGKFMQFYNNNQADSISVLFPPELRSRIQFQWHPGRIEELQKEFGKIVSYKYLGQAKADPEKVTVFKVTFDNKSTKATSLTLDEQHYLGTFRFVTTSPEIEEMVKKSK